MSGWEEIAPDGLDPETLIPLAPGTLNTERNRHLAEIAAEMKEMRKLLEQIAQNTAKTD